MEAYETLPNLIRSSFSLWPVEAQANRTRRITTTLHPVAHLQYTYRSINSTAWNERFLRAIVFS